MKESSSRMRIVAMAVLSTAIAGRNGRFASLTRASPLQGLPAGNAGPGAGFHVRTSLFSSHPMQAAELVAVRVTQVGEVHLAGGSLAHAGRVLAGGSAGGKAGRVPGVGHVR